jgi:hypothetical protein
MVNSLSNGADDGNALSDLAEKAAVATGMRWHCARKCACHDASRDSYSLKLIHLGSPALNFWIK